MALFYISTNDSEGDVQLCLASKKNKKPITVTGAATKGQLRDFSGIVQSIDDFGPGATEGRRWRVTLAPPVAAPLPLRRVHRRSSGSAEGLGRLG